MDVLRFKDFTAHLSPSTGVLQNCGDVALGAVVSGHGGMAGVGPGDLKFFLTFMIL